MEERNSFRNHLAMFYKAALWHCGLNAHYVSEEDKYMFLCFYVSLLFLCDFWLHGRTISKVVFVFAFLGFTSHIISAYLLQNGFFDNANFQNLLWFSEIFWVYFANWWGLQMEELYSKTGQISVLYVVSFKHFGACISTLDELCSFAKDGQRICSD